MTGLVLNTIQITDLYFSPLMTREKKNIIKK